MSTESGAPLLAWSTLQTSRHGRYLTAALDQAEAPREHRTERPVDEHSFAWLHPEMDGWRVDVCGVVWIGGVPQPGALQDSLWLDPAVLGSPEVPLLDTAAEQLGRAGWRVVGPLGPRTPSWQHWAERGDGWWAVLATGTTPASGVDSVRLWSQLMSTTTHHE